ncbi:MAG: riboflavin biosynthesis protein [Rhodocyclaceae bacterium]|uniref:Riboflavin biosynthesis protein n=1 Tax=Candidatus Desulfobacillus denitrificans TaxID=2608985 RepID=A0A809RZF3_9PROT|nr:bifunctional riboflavin kinase/FAD synthetase [Candidatus Desulfobacillus denitrificans]GIK46401.1 MAG: riboflavin biosynthesis protein [Betaproteobacteria bacterium]GJQ55936.1 MAG: riboflavin biosynthesis protein [Rhodocyclaceae bacterium]
MRVFRGIPARATHSTVLTIGNFDGVHCGHRALLARLTGLAQQAGLPAAVMTFEPNPREFFAPQSAPARLASLREKLQLLAECGVDQAYVCAFNQRFAALGADAFVERIVRGLGVRHLMIGDDFRFGKGRSGDFALLQQAGKEHGFGVEAMETLVHEGERVSSSAVREALDAGDLEHAERLLGRPYCISGRVIHGQKLGRKLGYATANIQLKRLKAPLSGIFVVTVDGIGARQYEGVASLGVRPTVSASGKPTLEVYIFDFEGDLYRAHLRVNFLHKLRDEAKFDSLDALQSQIARDVADAKAHHAALRA